MYSFFLSILFSTRIQKKNKDSEGPPWWLNGKESACDTGDPGSISGWGGSPGERNGNPLQYSCLQNPMDRGDWWATANGPQRVRQDWPSKPPPLCWKLLSRVTCDLFLSAESEFFRLTPPRLGFTSAGLTSQVAWQ